jgi:hypothetical protein
MPAEPMQHRQNFAGRIARVFSDISPTEHQPGPSSEFRGVITPPISERD